MLLSFCWVGFVGFKGEIKSNKLFYHVSVHLLKVDGGFIHQTVMTLLFNILSFNVVFLEELDLTSTVPAQ